MRITRRLSILACTTVLTVPVLAMEQKVWAADSTFTIEEIVVTSRKRDESLIEVPDSITVFTAEQIEAAGIRNVTDMANLTPNMFFTPTYRPSEMQMTIRGIPTAQGGEAPVAVIIDGVQIAHPTFVNQELMDIQQIEVLRGPQGSLYGRNAIGGAINIVTKQPTNDFEGLVRGSYASGNDFRGAVVLSGPIVQDKLLFRVTGMMRDYDGQIKDQTAVRGGRNADFDKSYIAKASLLLNASENLKIELRGNYLDQTAGAPTIEIVNGQNSDNYSQSFLNRNVMTFDEREIKDVSLKIDYDFGAVKLTSISGYSKSVANLFGDADFTPAPILLQQVDLSVKALTQEVRLASNDDGRVNWLVGFYYQDRDTDNFLQIPFDDGTGQPGGGFAIQSFDVGSSKSVAGFGSASIDITDQLEFTVGMRLDSDKRKSVDAAFAGSDAGETFKSLQPKVQLRYQWTDEMSTYASYGRGFRSGGFNSFFAVGGADRGFDKEISDSFEIGFKGQFMDGQLLVNAAAFYTKFDNQQFFFVTVDPPSQNITNINKVDITGFEFDITARPTNNLDITASVGFVDSSIKDFDGTGLYIGNKAPQSPQYTMGLTMQYLMPLSDGVDLRAYAAYMRRGPIYWDMANVSKTPAKDIINLRLFLELEQWSIGGYVDNLTNARYPTQFGTDAFGPDAHSRVPSPKRQFGVQGTVRF